MDDEEGNEKYVYSSEDDPLLEGVIAEEHVGVADSPDFVVSRWIDFLFLVCGISVFAR